MFKICICIFSLICFSKSYSQNCTLLSDGKYEVYYDSNLEKIGNIEISGTQYLYLDNNIQKAQNIIPLNDCSFKLESSEEIDDSKLTEIQRVLKNRKDYYEILKIEGNIYYFICRVNLHINCGSGKFIKVN